MLDYSPALMTDMYEYTMLDACLRDGTANRKCVFEIFTRHLPLGRHYGVAAGQGRILDALENFHLDDNDLKFLADRKVVGPETIKWLENFHFSGSIKGYREGEMFFPNSPILQVEGTFGECTLLETLLLSILNYDSAVASAASRMVSAAKDRPCMDMGGRRTNEWAAVAAARAAVVGGFKGTANLLAAQMYGLKAIGTAAHCFTLVHDDERSAFESQIAALGKNTTLLVDMKALGENQVQIDCDVLQADGGTRTASITGAYVALVDAMRWAEKHKHIRSADRVIKDSVSAVSVGVIDGKPMLDLPYIEDSKAMTDMNVAMTGSGEFIEIQGTAEHRPFNRAELNTLLDLAEKGNKELQAAQQAALAQD